MKHKIDYKRKSGRPPRRANSRYSPHKTSKIKGLIIIIAFFLVLIIGAYYLLNQKPISNNNNMYSDSIPSINHFLLINQSRVDRGLNSVVMLSFHKNTKTAILSFFPAELSLDKNKSLSYYYSKKGAEGVSIQFSNLFGTSFQYVVLLESFYENVSLYFKNVLIYLENKHDLIFPYTILQKAKKSNNHYLINGKNITKYLHFKRKSHTLSSLKTKRIRLLYTLMSFLSKGEQLFNMIKTSKASYFGAYSITINQLELYKKPLSEIRLVKVFSYPFNFIQKNKLFYLKFSPKKYIQFIQSITNISVKNKTFTPNHYLKAIGHLGYINFKKKIRLKVIDQSGRGYQYSSKSFKTFFNILNLDVVSYLHEEDIINKSYLVNSNHNLEVLNYVQGALRVEQIYNSGNKSNEFYDIILVIGKDFTISGL